MISGSHVDSTEDFLGVPINVPIPESETGAICLTFLQKEWVCKCDSFSWAIMVGDNMYFIFILRYISIVVPSVSFAFHVVDFVGDWATPFHP